ncbi:MAG: galactose oxidase, partial [Streptomyces sp.]|nr:galactose oxidase [Streptomyces sp.]
MKDQAGRRRARRFAIGTVVVLALAGMNGPWLYRFGTERYHQYTINKPGYKAKNGHWEILEFPKEYRQDTIHAALLHTGKVLLVAGSGNNQDNFDKKQFDTRIWDPVKGTIKKIHTPSDLFCTGHTQLANGNLLIAGGTKRYEKLKGDVTKAGGLMVVHNENPDKPITLPAGTRFTGKVSGKTFVSKDPVLVPRAKKMFAGTGKWMGNKPGIGRIYVEAPRSGQKYETGTEDNYRVQGLTGADARNTYGIANKLGLDKKDFQGIRDTFEFDAVAEKYIKVDPMNEARWYPTLTTLSDGRILSVSGLDDMGQLVPGKNEIFDPKTKKWRYTPKVRQFPTYPALFLMQNGKIFYSGSNAGYGPDNVGRDPGIWDVDSNKFTKLPGLSDPDKLETSGTVLLPPAQDEKFLVLGGGGVGES